MQLSVNPTHIECHLKDSGHPSPDETLSLQMRVFSELPFIFYVLYHTSISIFAPIQTTWQLVNWRKESVKKYSKRVCISLQNVPVTIIFLCVSRKKTSVSVLPSSLVLYYSHSGGDYELLVEQQLMYLTLHASTGARPRAASTAASYPTASN